MGKEGLFCCAEDTPVQPSPVSDHDVSIALLEARFTSALTSETKGLPQPWLANRVAVATALPISKA